MIEAHKYDFSAISDLLCVHIFGIVNQEDLRDIRRELVQ